MAKICVFCGKEIGRWKDQNLLCGNVLQTVCENCWECYQEAPPIQRARLVLETGRALEPEKVQAFLEQEEERAAKEAKHREYQQKSLLCCGQRMTQGEEYSFMDQTPFSLIHPRTPLLRLFRCELCGQVKLFDARFLSEEQPEIPVPPQETPGEPVKPTRVRPGEKPPWEK